MPTIGDVLNHKGQIYRCVETFDRPNQSGGKTHMFLWESDCPDCGNPFAVATTKTRPAPYNRRRCDECCKPGVEVRQIRKASVFD